MKICARWQHCLYLTDFQKLNCYPIAFFKSYILIYGLDDFRTVLFESHPNHISECSPWKSLPDSTWVFENRLNISNVVSVHKFSFREDFAPLLTSRYVSNGDQSNLYNLCAPHSLVSFAPSEVSNCGGAVASADTRCPPPRQHLTPFDSELKTEQLCSWRKSAPPPTMYLSSALLTVLSFLT